MVRSNEQDGFPAGETMRIKIVGNWQFELIPDSTEEEKMLHKTYAEGHLHFVCKSIYRRPRTKRERLLITPSIITWKRPQPRSPRGGITG